MNIPVMTTTDMRVVELNTEYLGISLGTLMQQAGREIARVISESVDISEKKIAILCGTGGNGGDGMVAARYLATQSAQVYVYLIGDENRISSSDTQDNWDILQKLWTIEVDVLRTESAIKKMKEISNSDIIVDGLLGFGLSSNVREPAATAIKMINKSQAKIFSIDVPSGINSDTGEKMGVAVKADCTITLHVTKIGLEQASEYVGKLIVAPIGIPDEASIICGKGDIWLFNRPRKNSSHKGDFGRVLVVGGSNVFSGAPALSGMASLRAGADLVSLAVPNPVLTPVRSYSPNLMVASLDCDFLHSSVIEDILLMVEDVDVVAIGPGLGREPDTEDAVQTLLNNLSETEKRIVIDADALKAIAGSGITFDESRVILTPHWGELHALLQQKPTDAIDDERIHLSLEAAKMYNATVLLKGAKDMIVQPNGRYKVNRTGVPAMTVGGTGDVLTGIAATFLTRNYGALYAASAAAFVSGLAGEYAFEKFGNHITATDCIECIPKVMNTFS